ncbi:MAG: hypothetical protein U0736_12540 [Gemmataceae bacterium]
MIDAVSYLAVVAALLRMRLRPMARPAEAGLIGRRLVEGFRYAFGFPPIRALLLLLALMSLLGMPYSVLLPVFAADVLHGGPNMLGCSPARREWGGGRGVAAGVAADRARAGPVDRHRFRHVRAGLIGFAPVAVAGCSPWSMLVATVLHDGANGRQQHHPADDRRGGQAGASDELAQHGVPRGGRRSAACWSARRPAGSCRRPSW